LRLVALLFLVFPQLLFAQRLHLTSTAGSPGDQVSVTISLTSPRGQEQPSSLQWELTVPINQISLVDENLVPGREVQAAGKSIACRIKTKSVTVQTSICLVYGGREPIADGVVALLKLKVAADAQPRPAQIRIDRAVAVLKDLKRIPMEPVETTVRIRGK
jgi:hypothetical protein